MVRKAKMAVGLEQNLKGTCLKIERKKMEFWRIGAWSIVKNNTCKECPEFLPLTSVWLIQTSLHTLNNLSLIFYLHTNHSPKKIFKFFLSRRDPFLFLFLFTQSETKCPKVRCCWTCLFQSWNLCQWGIVNQKFTLL